MSRLHYHGSVEHFGHNSQSYGGFGWKMVTNYSLQALSQRMRYFATRQDSSYDESIQLKKTKALISFDFDNRIKIFIFEIVLNHN